MSEIQIEEKKKKKPVNGKRKGSGGERNVCKLLGEHLAPLSFRKTEGSGAIVGGKNFATIGAKFSKEALRMWVGDVYPTNESECNQNFRFVVECKHYKDPEKIHHLLTKTVVNEWMDEVRLDAAKLELEPILIFKWNNTPYMAAINSNVEVPTKNSITLETLKIVLLDDLLKSPEFWLIDK